MNRFLITLILFACAKAVFAQDAPTTEAIRLTTGTVQNTVLHGNSNQIPVSTGVAVRNSASDLPLQGTNNAPQLVASPFVSTTDFRILSNSPVFNAGTLQGLRPTDITGRDLHHNPRIACDSIDIGAVEYPIITTAFTLQPVNQGICEGTLIIIRGEAQGSGLITYQLQRDGVNVGATNTTGAFMLYGNLTDAGEYRIIAQGDCCRDTSDVVTITVDPLPMVELVIYDTTIYEGDAVPLQILSYVGDEVYWEDQYGNTYPHSDDLVIPNIMETTEFTAVVKNGGCSEYATATLIVTVDGSPCVIAIAGPTDTTICVGERYRLRTDPANTTATVTGWEVVGSTQTHEQGELVSPTITTQYRAVGEVKDGEGRTCSSPILTITVHHVDLTIRPDEEFCGAQEVELWSIPSANVRWYTIDGEFIDEGNIMVQTVANTRNRYVASLTEGRCTKRDTVSLYANPPDLQVFARDTTICEGESLQLTTNIEARFVEWIPTHTGTPLHDEDPIVQPIAGNYVFVAWAWDDICGDVSDTAFVIVQAHPEFEIMPVPMICPLEPVYLLAAPNASFWTDIEGYRIDNPISPEATMEIVGVYFDGVCTVFDTVVVEVETVNFIVRADTTIFQGDTVELWSDPVATQWLDYTTSHPVVLTDLFVHPDDTTLYAAVLETANCTFIEYVTIYVMPVEDPVIDSFDIFVDAGSGCFNGDGWVWAIVTGETGPYEYAWHTSTGIKIGSDSIIEGLSPGIYTVTVTDFAGIVTLSESVEVLPPPPSIEITFHTISPTVDNPTEGEIRVIAVTGGIPPYYYEWFDENHIPHNNGNAEPSILSEVGVGIYLLTVTDSAGCSKTDSVELELYHPRRVMPTLYISPNDDGKNDFLSIQYIEQYETNKVIILNSYGEEIITIHNYSNLDPSRQWNGRNSRGQVLPDGIYYYIIEAPGTQSMAGWLMMRASKSK